VIIENPNRETVARRKEHVSAWLSCFCLAFGLLPFVRGAPIQIGSTNVSSGAAFALPVTIDCGTNALGCYLFGLNYDPAVLQVTGITAESAFPDITFNTNFRGYLVALGINASSLTSPTGLVSVARISFTAIGSPGSTTALEFASGPVSPLEVCNTDAIDLPVQAVNGVVNVGLPSIDQLVPCAGPTSGGVWKNHGQYVAAVSKVVALFLAEGLVTEEEEDAIMAKAAHSSCGSRPE